MGKSDGQVILKKFKRVTGLRTEKVVVMFLRQICRSAAGVLAGPRLAKAAALCTVRGNIKGGGIECRGVAF
jgi:hypothetical protein